jgi:hypothetical protein
VEKNCGTPTPCPLGTVPSFLCISKHVDISAGAVRMTASLVTASKNVHWEIYYYPQGSPLRVDISACDLLWKFNVSLRTPSEMSQSKMSQIFFKHFWDPRSQDPPMSLRDHIMAPCKVFESLCADCRAVIHRQ